MEHIHVKCWTLFILVVKYIGLSILAITFWPSFYVYKIYCFGLLIKKNTLVSLLMIWFITVKKKKPQNRLIIKNTFIRNKLEDYQMPSDILELKY